MEVNLSLTTNSKIICIVDDELDITQLFHDALCGSIEDVSVISFNDPVKAFEHFADNRNTYALIISDLRMPNLNGLELLKKVKKLNPKVRTILVSAFEVENDPVFQQYMKEGLIDKFIQKPVPIKGLCQEVNDQVRAYKSTVNK